MLLGISAVDWVMLGLYFGATVAIGIYTANKVKDTTDFFMGGRRFGKAFMIFFAFGAGTSGNDAVGVSSKTYTNGLSGIWYQWLWLFCTPFYWLIAPVMRRMRCLTTGDYFEHRYSGSVAGLYTLIGIAQLTVNIGIIQLGAGSMIEGISGGAIHKEWAIIAMTILFVIYGVAGGLAAAIITDFMQGILTVILSFILIPFALNAVGGFSGMHDKIEDPHMFSLVAPGEVNLFWIFMLGLNSLIGIVTQPHIMGVCAAGRTEMDGRVGFAVGNLVKRLCTVAWTVVGLCAVVMYMGQDVHPDQIYGLAASELLPEVMAGLVGLFLAALIASVMSSCDAFMVSCSGLFTQNFYRRWVASDKTETHYVWVGRIAAFCIVVGGVAFAFLVGDVPNGLLIFFKMQALMGAAFWLGLFWRRTTVAGAWAATLAALGILLFTSGAGFNTWAAGNSANVRDVMQIATDSESTATYAIEEVAAQHGTPVDDFIAWNGWQDEQADPERTLDLDQRVTVSAPALPTMMIWDGKLRDSWQIFFYLVVGFGGGIIVSLVTPRVPEGQIERVFRALRTPVNAEEAHHPEPFTIPDNIAVPEPNKLINHPDLEIPKPSTLAFGGFIGIWAIVGLLIGFVYWMATWGA